MSTKSEIEQQAEESEHTLRQIKECLRFYDGKGIKTIILEHKLKDTLIFWELVSAIGECITAENLEKEPGFFEACERCLKYLIKNGDPKELLLAFLEQADTFEDDVKFQTFLGCIQQALFRLPTKRHFSLELALETLSNHIHSLPIPKELNLEGEERKLLDAHPDILRVTDLLLTYLDFLKPFVWDVSILNSDARPSRKEYENHIQILMKHLLSILEHPVICLDLSWSGKEELTSKSSSRVCAEQIVKFLGELKPDLHKIITTSMQQRESMNHVKQSSDFDEDVVDNSNQEKQSPDLEKQLPELGIACLAYLLHSEKLGVDHVPSIYTHCHMLEFHLPIISHLLQKSQSLVISKGVHLLQAFMGNISVTSIPCENLDNPHYGEVLSMMVQIMIGCSVKEVRMDCVHLLPEYVNMFDISGRYQLFSRLFYTANHSGVIGYVTQLLKDQIDASLKKPEPDKQFIGGSLEKLLRQAIALPDGPATDLLENSDKVIAVLNLIRYLIIRDPPVKNMTGLWNWFLDIETSFLTPLRTGLNMSKGHYGLELKNLQDKKPNAEEGNTMDFGLTICGQMMPQMPKDQQIAILKQALNTFDMIDIVLSRVVELADQQKMSKR